MDGEHETVLSNTNMDEDDLEIIGKIITHAFIQYGIFPVKLCKSSLKKVLLGNVSDEELLQSFMQFLPSRKAGLVETFFEIIIQPIIDILSEYGVFEFPTSDNVLMKKAAKVALVRLTFSPIQCIVKGMSSFWGKV